MTPTDALLTFLTYFSVWLPLLIALLARRSPTSLRIVLALAGGVSGLFALDGYFYARQPGGHPQATVVVAAPFLTAGLSLYIIFTGFCSVVAFAHFRGGGGPSPAMILLAVMAFCALAFGAFVLFSSLNR